MENNNDVFKKEIYWNGLTKKQENTFGFTVRKEIFNFSQKLIQKHAPKELRNYQLNLGRVGNIKSVGWYCPL